MALLWGEAQLCLPYVCLKKEKLRKYCYPRVTCSGRKVTYSELRMTYTYPKVTWSDPKMTYSDPKVTYSDPMLTYSGPKVTHSDPIYTPPLNSTYLTWTSSSV